MEQVVKDRILKVIAEKKTNLSAISGGNGTPLQVKMSRQLNGATTLTYDVLGVILETFPDVSAEWLLRGTGNMILSPETPVEIPYLNAPGAHDNITNIGDNNRVNNSVNQDLPTLTKEQALAKLVEQNQALIELLAK